MAFSNNEGSGQSSLCIAQTHQSLHCLYTKSMDVDEDSDKNSEL